MSFNISSLVLGIFVGFHIIFCYKYTHKGIKRYTQITCTDHLYSLFSPPDDVCHKSWRCRDLLGVTTNRRNGTNVTSVRSTAFREKNTDQHARNTEWSQINVNQHDHIIYIRYILWQYLQIYFRQNIARFAKPAFNWRIAPWYFFHSIIKHKKTWTETTDVSSKSILICFSTIKIFLLCITSRGLNVPEILVSFYSHKGGLTLMQFLQNALQCTAKHTKMLLKLNVIFEFHNHYILKVLDWKK